MGVFGSVTLFLLGSKKDGNVKFCSLFGFLFVLLVSGRVA